MGVRKFWNPADMPITLEQHRALNLKRPYTDHPIGGLTDGKRSSDAFLSALFDETDAFEIRARSNPDHIDIYAKDREHADKRRARVRARKAAAANPQETA